MKKIIFGILLIPFAMYFNNTFGMYALVSTKSAMQTVNGGGMEYQVARSLATLPALGFWLFFLATALILWGVIERALKSPTK